MATQQTAQGRRHGGAARIRSRGALLAATAWLALSFSSVQAAPAALLDTPNALSLLSIDAYPHAVEQDDLLIVARYEIEYTTVPSDIATETFIFKVLDETGAEIGHNTPFAFIENGYTQGVVSAYFSPKDAPQFEAALTLRFEGNPAFFATPPVFTTTSIDWHVSSSHADTIPILKTDVIELAGQLEERWDTLEGFGLLILHSAGGTVLTDFGATYFDRAVAGLRQMAPTLYQEHVIQIAPTPASFDQTYSDELSGRIDGTAIGQDLGRIADGLNVSTGLVKVALSFAAFLTVYVLLRKKIESERVALIISSAGVGVTLPLVGLLPMAAMGLFGLLAGGIIAFVLFFGRG